MMPSSYTCPLCGLIILAGEVRRLGPFMQHLRDDHQLALPDVWGELVPAGEWSGLVRGGG